jgi:flagellar hook-length control protein FliK
MPRPPLQQINIYRATRVPMQRDLSLGAMIDAAVAPAKASVKASTQLEGMLPAAVAKHVATTTLARGTLTLVTASAASAHIVGSWLRGGGEAFIRTKMSRVKKVRTQIH